MIPSIEDIIRMLKAGECTEDQAAQWLGSHIDQAINREVLRDSFAGMVDLARDADGNLLVSSVEAVMGSAGPEQDAFKHSSPKEKAERFKWWCLAEARIRYAKASAMMEARCL